MGLDQLWKAVSYNVTITVLLAGIIDHVDEYAWYTSIYKRYS